MSMQPQHIKAKHMMMKAKQWTINNSYVTININSLENSETEIIQLDMR